MSKKLVPFQEHLSSLSFFGSVLFVPDASPGQKRSSITPGESAQSVTEGVGDAQVLRPLHQHDRLKQPPFPTLPPLL